MTKIRKNRLSLDQPVTYQIKVPGVIDVHRADWARKVAITVDREDEGFPITTMTGEVDQAALHGLLRRLYSLVLPLIFVQWIEGDLTESDEPNQLFSGESPSMIRERVFARHRIEDEWSERIVLLNQ